MTSYTLPLHGLNCMGCARKVEKALTELPDTSVTAIDKHQVNLETNTPLKILFNAIQSLGYQAGHKQELSLSGLSCGKCVKKLQDEFAQHSQIFSFEVTKTDATVYSLLEPEELISIVESAGYQASLPSEEPSEVTEEVIEPALQSVSPVQVSETETIQLTLTGMTCASCVSSVEKSLLKVDSAKKVQVNLAEQSALVFVDDASDKVKAELIHSVDSAGYGAEVVTSEQERRAQQAAQFQAAMSHHKKASFLALSIGAPLMLWGVLGGNMMIRHTQDQWIWGVIGVICLWLLAVPGKHFFVNAWKSLTHKRATMDTLVALGTGAAWLYSMIVVLFPEWLPAQSRHVYFEASAMIIGLISLGHFIEAKAKAKTTQSLEALMDLQPETAIVINEHGQESEVSLSQVTIGMKLRIHPGAKIPVDGEVIQGESYVDESMLTGEPIPKARSVGEQVSAGTINQDGALIIQATTVGANTMLARIITMVRQAQSSKPQIAKLADSISAVFVPVVVAIAIVSALIWYAVGPAPQASYMLIVATTVLIIACPCALGLATPLSVTVGVGKAAELGVLIKDADVIQQASKVDMVVFDKTGTLTEGKPSVSHVQYFGEWSESNLLSLVYAAESSSEHPLAKALCAFSDTAKNTSLLVEQFENHRGKGLAATINGQQIHIGNAKFVDGEKVFNSESKPQGEFTEVYVTVDNTPAAVFYISDSVKPEAKEAITLLHAMGIKVAMLSGDNQKVARSVANELGIDEVIADVLPDQKASHIEQLQQQGYTVAMVGDGINDAPALALANVSMAMGGGSDLAIESAQMTLLNTSPVTAAKAIELSKATVKNMKQNLFGAFIYNTLGIPVAAGVLYPAFGFLLSPVVAGAAMALSSITVVSNANRLRLFKIK
ncbi:Copper-exporting P-type ATPase A [Vibrio nigripulchritudo SOn1]|uniref:Copper-exporting P-type ATPase n=1 Tax=Vibrio nigripulchritudo SOn1 TaxID=1238450 RepID=A0AAV2VJM7_9VIBR|nr:copper-translocating P-type ATPase [Vibrio nigripulchritudo]CCO44614.1 Copper-exporting P-type ATPase A [Vibrio nigripulchritudo SOn1]